MNAVSVFSLYASSLLLGSLAALAAGCGGIWFFALEGVMLTGGLAGMMASALPMGTPLLAAGAAGAVYACALGAALLRLRGEQRVFGAAVNGFSVALAMIVARLTGGFHYSRKAFQWTVGDGAVSLFIPAAALLFLAGWLALYHSRWGLRLRACGETPQTAEKLGVSVFAHRMAGLCLGGFCAGLGGAACLVALGGGWRVEAGLGGMGFLALAAASLGRWRAWPAACFALLLALAKTGLDWAVEMGWLGADAAGLIPFALSAALLVLAERKKRGPRALRGA